MLINHKPKKVWLKLQGPNLLPKQATGMMMVVGMSVMPLRVIGKEICLQVRGLFKLSKDLGPKRHLNVWKESKETREFMKVEKGGVHHNRYDDHCKK
jgi:hypothetical protein